MIRDTENRLRKKQAEEKQNTSRQKSESSALLWVIAGIQLLAVAFFTCYFLFFY